MKLISPKDARAIALKREIRIVKKEIKRSAKCGDAIAEFRGDLFPETILMLEEAGYVIEVVGLGTCIYWGGKE